MNKKDPSCVKKLNKHDMCMVTLNTVTVKYGVKKTPPLVIVQWS